MARPKIHYFPFVAREYLSDLAIRPLNLEERGLFIEYLCWMWESPVRGALFRPDFAPVSPEFRLHNIVVPLLASKSTPEADLERAKELERKLLETSLIREGIGGVLYNRRLLFYTTEYELKLLSKKEFPEFQERILRVIPITDVSPEFRQHFAEVSPPKHPISINKAKENLQTKEKRGGRQKAPTPAGYQFLVDQIHEIWERETKTKITWNGADGRQLQFLMRRQPADTILAAWPFYLKNPDSYCRWNGLSFRNFVASFDKVATRLSGISDRDLRFANLKETADATK